MTHVRTALGFILQRSKKPARYKNDKQSNCKIHIYIHTYRKIYRAL